MVALSVINKTAVKHWSLGWLQQFEEKRWDKWKTFWTSQTRWIIRGKDLWEWHGATALCLHIQGKAGFSLPQMLLSLLCSQSHQQQIQWKLCDHKQHLDSSGERCHSVLSLAGIVTLILKFPHYVWIHVRFHFAMGDWLRKKSSSESPALLCLTLCQMKGKTLSHRTD